MNEPRHWVALSGAVPLLEELRKHGWVEADIRVTALRIIERVFEAGWGIVHGSHPTFAPLVERLARDPDAPNAGATRVRILVARRYFKGVQDLRRAVRRQEPFAHVEPVGDFKQERQPALTELREQLIAYADAIVCVGGRLKEDNKELPGVQEETDKALKKRIPTYLVGSCGGYTRLLYEDRYQRKPDLFRNGLTPEENEALGLTAGPWEAARLVVEGLHRCLDAAARRG